MNDTLRAVRPPIPAFPHSTRNRRGWQEVFLVGLLLLVLTVIYFWPQLVGGRVLYWGDIGLYFLPMTAFLRANLLAGHLPLWNPLILCGTPFVGNPQTWPLYPISCLLPLMSAGYFLSVTVAIHVWLASLGAFLFLRRAEGLGARASLVGAIVFGFGGQLVSKEQFPNMVQAIAWLPWVLWAVWGMVRDGRLANAVCLGFLIGLQTLAAHAQMSLLTLYVGAAYGVYLLIAASQRPQWGALAGRVAVAGVVALGLCAVQVLPILELYLSAWRQKLPFAAVDRFTLPVNQLGNFVLPTLHGSPFWGNFTGRGNFWETCCYVSVLGFALAALGIVVAWRGSEQGAFRFWSVVAGVGVWMALGGKGGLYHLAYAILPGFRSFHDPARCLLWSAWGLSVLAAFGWDWVQQRIVRPTRRGVIFAACVGFIFVDLVHFGRSLYPLIAPSQLSSAAALPASEQSVFDAHQGRILAPDTARVWQRFTNYHSFGRDTPNYLSDWLQTYTPNLSMLSGTPAAFGYEPEARRDAQMVAGRANDALRPGATWANRREAMHWAGVLGVREVVFYRNNLATEPLPFTFLLENASGLLPTVTGLDGPVVQVCGNELWQPRARLVTNFVAVRSRAAAFGVLARSSETVIVGRVGFPSRGVDGWVGFGSSGIAGRFVTPTAARIVVDTPDLVVVEADNKSPALLVLADTLHPGWHALVDHKEAPILSADGFLRAVVLPAPGAHRVVFEYRPTSFLLGCYLSLLTVCSLLSFGAFLLCKRNGFFRNTAGVSAKDAE